MGVEELRGATVLVTGATGRLGPHLCARLEELGARVVPVVLPGYPRRPTTVPWSCAAEPVALSATSDLAGMAPPDHVINLHWKVDREQPAADQLVHELEVNVKRPAFLWDWLRSAGPGRFLNASTVHVFSHLNGPSVTSADEPRPVTPYGIAKLAGEKFFTAAFAGSRLRPVHLRLSSITSPGEHDSRLISRLLASGLDGTPIGLEPRNRVAFLYVDEAVDLMISAALAGDRDRYMLAGAELEVGAIAAAAEARLGRPLRAEVRDAGKPARQPTPIPDVEPLRQGWVRTVTLEAALDAMIAARARSPAGDR